jgi:hypothetical protein
MNTLIRQLAIAGLCLLSAGAAMAGTAKVTYQNPANYADIPFPQWERDEVLRGLTEHFEKLARNLPEDQQLQVEVTDLDLAGRLIPSVRYGRDIRVLRGGADWPHLDMRFAVTQGDQVLKSGEAKLADMAYLNRIAHYYDGDELRYEKQMIDDWFYKEITPRKRR